MIPRDRRAVTRDCYVNGRGSGRLSTVMRTCVTRQFMVRGNIRGTKPRFKKNRNYECLANWGKSKGFFFQSFIQYCIIKGCDCNASWWKVYIISGWESWFLLVSLSVRDVHLWRLMSIGHRWSFVFHRCLMRKLYH